MRYFDLDKTASYQKLLALAPRGRDFDYAGTLDAGRVRDARTHMAAGLVYSWAAKPVDTPVLELLQALSEEQELIGKYRALLEGAIVNTGESRKVLHHLLRGQDGKAVTGKPVIDGGKDLGACSRAAR